MRAAWLAMMARNFCRASGSSRAGPCSVSTKPRSDASGVRSSWLALAMKSARIWARRSCSVRSRKRDEKNGQAAAGANGGKLRNRWPKSAVPPARARKSARRWARRFRRPCRRRRSARDCATCETAAARSRTLGKSSSTRALWCMTLPLPSSAMAASGMASTRARQLSPSRSRGGSPVHRRGQRRAVRSSSSSVSPACRLACQESAERRKSGQCPGGPQAGKENEGDEDRRRDKQRLLARGEAAAHRTQDGQFLGSSRPRAAAAIR